MDKVTGCGTGWIKSLISNVPDHGESIAYTNKKTITQWRPSSTVMQIVLNGKTQQIGENSSVQTVLEDMKLQGKRVAVEVNQEIIPRARHHQHKLVEGDRVEIIHAVGGG